jgi:autotransporter-associated beta strand protein
MGSVTRVDGMVSNLSAMQQSTGSAWAGDLIFGSAQSNGAAITIATTGSGTAPATTARLFLGETPADVQTWGNLTLNNTMKLVIGGNVSAGTLSIGGNATAANTRIVGNSSANSTLSLTGGAITPNVTVGGAGVNENKLSLVKTGTGTLTLGGTHRYTGATTVNGGSLTLTGSIVSSIAVNSSAKLTAGDGASAGALTVAAGGSFVLNSATFLLEKNVSLAGTTQISVKRTIWPNCGRLAAGGVMTFGGALTIVNDGPALKLGDRFPLFYGTIFTGSFAQFSLPSLEYNLQWDTSQLAVDGSIRVVTATSPDTVSITLTPGTFHQRIRGIGGNFCQGEQGVLIAYNRFDEMFSADGLNMSFIRLGNTYEITEPLFANMAANNITAIQEFRARQPYGSVMMTAWSPPSVLKSTASPFQGTLAKNAGGQYRYTDYANWWTRSLQYYNAANALPDYISIQNEPDFTPSGTTHAYESGCYFAATESSTKAGYPQALAAVRTAFQTAGFGSMKMIGPDTTAIAGNKIPSYLDNIPAGQIDAIAHHLYHDSPASTGVTALNQLQTQYPYWDTDKFMTELNPFDTYETYDATQPGWMQLAVTMHNVFVQERANTYMVWSSMYGFINRTTGQPNNDDYYALGHFSKYVRPLDWRVAVSSDDPDVYVSHYRHYYGPGLKDRQIIVLINKSAARKQTTIGTAASWATAANQRFWQVFRTATDGTTKTRLTMVEVEQGASLSGNRTLVLPPYSLTTALINIQPNGSPYTNQDVWRFTHFGSLENAANAADAFDANGDGETNLLEFATGQNPNTGTLALTSVAKNGVNLEFIYTRAEAAVTDGVTFAVEWSDTLTAQSWTSVGAGTLLSDNGTLQTLKATVPFEAGPKRFLRLKITR